MRPRALCLGNLFRDQLDRYGELELVAERWREAVEALPAGTTLVVNGDDPQVGELARARPGAVVFGLDDPRLARPSLQHAADSKYCVLCGTPYEYAAAYVGHLGDYRCPACGHARPALDVVARDIELEGLEHASFSLETPEGTRRVKLRVPGSTTSTTPLAAAALSRALGMALDDVAAGLERFDAAFGRFERIAIGDRRVLLLLIKNPAGANEAIRTLVEGRSPTLAVIALNDAIADGKDVSWIWDVDFEPLLAGLERVVATGDRAAELALRCKYAGFAVERIEVVPDLRAALDRGLALATRRRSSSSCRRTPRCSRCARSSASSATCGRTGNARREDPRRPPVPRLPEHLRRPREHGGARAARFVARARARGRGDLDRGRASAGRARPAVRRRRPGSRAGARRGRPRRASRGRARGRRRAALPSSPCAAATSCSAARIASATAPSCPASASSLSTRSPASEG